MTPNHLSKIVVVCGPTGVGKTGFAVRVAQRLGGEIVGADSMQIYRFMDIGTAKPSAEERKAAPHHMVDIVDPDTDFDAVEYARLARQCVDRLVAEGALPLIVGGTGLYIKALMYGLTQGRPAAPEVRARLQEALDQSGAPQLHQHLMKVDPKSAARIHPNDSYRILRALEVLEVEGCSITELHKKHGFSEPAYNALYIGLTMPRDKLYERIDHRVEMMMEAGLEDEVRLLLERGYGPELKSMQALGYRHMVGCIERRVPKDEALRTLKRDHRRYAKRQMTWFKAVENIHWMAPDQTAQAEAMITRFRTPSTLA